MMTRRKFVRQLLLPLTVLGFNWLNYLYIAMVVCICYLLTKTVSYLMRARMEYSKESAKISLWSPIFCLVRSGSTAFQKVCRWAVWHKTIFRKASQNENLASPVAPQKSRKAIFTGTEMRATLVSSMELRLKLDVSEHYRRLTRRAGWRPVCSTIESLSNEISDIHNVKN